MASKRRERLYKEQATGIVRRSHPDEPDVKENAKERQYWRLMEIIPSNGDYTAYQRLDVLVAFASIGNMKKVQALYPDIPYDTMMYWKNGTKWWKPALREVHEMKDEELDARITGIIDKSLTAMEDRLNNGDEVISIGKDGGITRTHKKVSFRDVAVAGLGVGFDKRQLGRGKPTQRTEIISDQDRLKRLQAEFRRVARREPPRQIEDVEYEEVNQT